jgi:hypothetical protein
MHSRLYAGSMTIGIQKCSNNKKKVSALLKLLIRTYLFSACHQECAAQAMQFAHETDSSEYDQWKTQVLQAPYDTHSESGQHSSQPRTRAM